ncbi:hypothetical protein IQ265_05825 [Nodosilinea sp. LEGE 06152]|uniref:hypothetical protein n=1 Tax=Nodosilinea sp. LEGE 06152 TaxID=2777966 RepID=UPI001882ED35|nr:hypothetical protein [Nodosilinea sp. LEGE 06152]MBE9156348.1 hypothetical protein [Nodosilinea sp. LEGE 06152]
MDKLPGGSDQSSSQASMALERLLGQMSPAIARSFTESQREALQAALVTTFWQKHAIDLRLSIPLVLRRYYLVVVAGPEKRSQERRQQDQTTRSVSGQMAVAVAVTSLSLGLLAVLMHLTQHQTGAGDRPQASPAAVPFLGDRTACEHSGRTWQNGECLDFEHDPTF